MMKGFFCAVVGLTTFFVASAFAMTIVEENNVVKTVGDLGTSDNGAYFALIEGFKTPTKSSIVHIDLSKEWGKSAYQLLLHAKSHNLKIRRIIYDFDETAPDNTASLRLLTAW